MTREEAARRNTMQNELKPCPCGNTVEVKYTAGIGESLLKYINNPFASLMPTYYINCDKCGRSMMVRLKNPQRSIGTSASAILSKHGTGGVVMFDGKWDAKEAPECWIIKNRKNGNIVFSYRTYQGNEKKLCLPQQSMQKRH